MSVHNNIHSNNHHGSQRFQWLASVGRDSAKKRTERLGKVWVMDINNMIRDQDRWVHKSQEIRRKITLDKTQPDEKLHKACEEGDYEKVEELISHSKINSRNENGKTPLEIAYENSHFKIVELLLKNGATTNIEKVFINACTHQPVEVVRLFLNNVNINAPINGELPFHVVCLLGELDIIDCFLERDDLEIDGQDQYCQTALWKACKFPNRAVIQRLLEKGANPNITVDGESCLHRAIRSCFILENDDLRIVEMLLKAGACLDIKNKQGKTVYDVVIESKYKNKGKFLDVLDQQIMKNYYTLYNSLMTNEYI